MKNFITNFKIEILIACIHWFLSTLFQVDRLFFQYDTENKTMIVVKLLYLISLVAIYCYAKICYTQYKNKNKLLHKALRIFSITVVVLGGILLVLWPGTWAWDDIWVLNGDQHYTLTPWQHIFSGLWHMLCLQFIPTPGGIIFVQILVAAICITYIVLKFDEFYGVSSFDRIAFIIPFLFPPVLMYLYSGYRMGIYIFLELVLLINLISLKYDKICSMQKLVLIVFLTTLLASWRTESFIYILVTSVAIWMMKNNIRKREKIISVVSVIILFLGANYAQEKMLRSSNYKVISTLRPLAELIKVADKSSDSRELDSINKVIDLEKVYKNPNSNGEALYWNQKVVRENYTKEEFRSYIKSFLYMSVKYPTVVIKERYKVLRQSASLDNEITTNNTYGARTLFYKIKLGNSNDNTKKYFQSISSPSAKPVFAKAREKLICILGCMKSDFSLYPAYKVIWNHLIPTVFIVLFFILQILKKNYWTCGILLGLLGKWPIVFLTSPAPWIMYYLSFYLVGYIIFVYSIYYYLQYKKQGENNEK